MESYLVMRSSKFLFYLHDLAEFCQIQLIGDLTAEDVPELTGCCTTVKPTLKDRKLVIDARRLSSADAEGEQWLQTMKAQGAEVVRTTVDDSETLGIREGTGYLLRLLFRANRAAQ